jgi:hypothetical protein
MTAGKRPARLASSAQGTVRLVYGTSAFVVRTADVTRPRVASARRILPRRPLRSAQRTLPTTGAAPAWLYRFSAGTMPVDSRYSITTAAASCGVIFSAEIVSSGFGGGS